MNAREIVKRTLEFRNPPRVPRQLWTVGTENPQIARIRDEFPDDLVWTADYSVEDPQITQTEDPQIDGDSHRFVLAGRPLSPFGRLVQAQGAHSLLGDLLLEPPELLHRIGRAHRDCVMEAEAWAATDVDAIVIMDDWGGEKRMLVHPDTWRTLFKPLYSDYCAIARSAGKYVFMHSDGWILDIIEDLIEIGVDAMNVQVACMGAEELGKRFRGRVTFWGDVSQRVLTFGQPEDVWREVTEAREHLWASGGVIAQCEWGPGVKEENVREMFRCWNDPRREYPGITRI